MQVMEYDESNVFAAMGVAIILAEHNKIDESYEILKSIMDACPTQLQTPSIMINLAHLNMVLENYEAAINLYRTAIEKFPKGHGDLDCELYLSKALFMNNSFDQCQKRLVSLAIRYPNDMRVKFDLAICLYEQAQAVFNRSQRRVTETKEAIANLQQSKNLMLSIMHHHDPSPYLSTSLTPQQQKETLELQSAQLFFMRNVCDQKMGDLSAYLEQADRYLEFDLMEEAKINEKEERRRMEVKLLELT
jgi:tetratricopeptide (TPR) repeat protein